MLEDQTSSHLPSCPSCYRHRILFMLDRAVPSAEAVPGISVDWSDYARPEECKTCADWNYDCTNHVLDATLPAKYPPSHKTNDGAPVPPVGREVKDITHIKPMKMSFEILKTGCAFAFYHIQTGLWNKGESYCYLKSLGANTVWVSYFVGYALKPESSVDGIVWPATWTRDVLLEQHIDAVMHLFFHGCVKSTIKCIRQFLIDMKLNTQFGMVANNLLKELSRMQLTWLKLLPFTANSAVKVGGWMSENLLGYCRVADIFYLKVRTLITPPVEDTRHTEMLHRLDQLTASLVICASTLMTTEDEQTVREQQACRIENSVRLFLSSMEAFDKRAFPSRVKEMWRGKGNFVSLTNLVWIYLLYGSLRGYWDGDKERFIQSVKPVVRGGIRQSGTWMKNKVTQVYETQALKHATRSIGDSGSDSPGRDVDEYSRSGPVRMYRNRSEAERILMLSSGGVVSEKDNDGISEVGALCGIILRSGENHEAQDKNASRLLMAYQMKRKRNKGERSQLGFFELRYADNQGFQIGMNWAATMTATHVDNLTVESLGDLKHCISGNFCSIPIGTTDGEPVGTGGNLSVHIVINDHWKRRSNSGTFSLPVPTFNVFRSVFRANWGAACSASSAEVGQLPDSDATQIGVYDGTDLIGRTVKCLVGIETPHHGSIFSYQKKKKSFTVKYYRQDVLSNRAIKVVANVSRQDVADMVLILGEDDDRDDDGGLMAAPDDQEDDDSSDGEEGDDIIGHQCNSSIIEDWMFNEEDAGDNQDDPMGLSAEDSGMEEDLEGDNDHA